VGFETTAVSEEQKAAVEHAQSVLMVPGDLFVLEGNTCEVTDVVINVSSIVDYGKRQSQPEEHADHNDESAQAADRHDHERHGHDDEDDAPATDSHGDVSAAYAFKCDSDRALTQITFRPKGLPFGLERIDVFWVADWGQGAGRATRQTPQVTLRN
jgi:hypothetical protein